MDAELRRMLTSATLVLAKLKVFSVSTSKTISVLSCLNNACIAKLATSTSLSYPAHICKGPTTLWMSSFTVLRMAFPMILFTKSPIPIGQTSGILYKGIASCMRSEGHQIYYPFHMDHCKVGRNQVQPTLHLSHAPANRVEVGFDLVVKRVKDGGAWSDAEIALLLQVWREGPFKRSS